MAKLQHRFIEPLDVLFLRGNKLFGDPGSFAESLVPPWPSTAAGALRSWLLSAEGVDPVAFARGSIAHPSLGTPSRPGSFTLAAFGLAHRDARGALASLHGLPADLLVDEEAGRLSVRRLAPTNPAAGLSHSGPLPQLAVLPQSERTKHAAGYWLEQEGFARHLAGDAVLASDLVETGTLWKVDSRVGVGLDPATRRAGDGKLFSVQAVAFAQGVGFLASVAGADLPVRGTVRLGGDGRAASFVDASYSPPAMPLERIAKARRARIVLTSPGHFEQGWRPTGCDGHGRFSLGGVNGRLVCAAVPRAEVASGWDLATWQPKPAQRFAPAGTVYWLEDLEGSPESLGKLAERGLWDEPPHNDRRRAEGFNRFALAAY